MIGGEQTGCGGYSCSLGVCVRTWWPCNRAGCKNDMRDGCKQGNSVPFWLATRRVRYSPAWMTAAVADNPQASSTVTAIPPSALSPARHHRPTCIRSESPPAAASTGCKRLTPASSAIALTLCLCHLPPAFMSHTLPPPQDARARRRCRQAADRELQPGCQRGAHCTADTR